MITRYKNFTNEIYFNSSADITKRPARPRANDKFRVKNGNGTFHLSVLDDKNFYDGSGSGRPSRTGKTYRVGFRAPLVINSCVFSPSIDLSLYHFPEERRVEIFECRGVWDRGCYERLGVAVPHRSVELYLGFMFEDYFGTIAVDGVEDIRSHDPWEYWLAFCTRLQDPPYMDYAIRLDLDDEGRITPEDGLMFLARIVSQSRTSNPHRSSDRTPTVGSRTLWAVAGDVEDMLDGDRITLRDHMIDLFPHNSRCLGLDEDLASGIDVILSI